VIYSASYDLDDFGRLSASLLTSLTLVRYRAAQRSQVVFDKMGTPLDSSYHGTAPPPRFEVNITEDQYNIPLTMLRSSFESLINGDTERNSLGVLRRDAAYQSPEILQMFLENACIGHEDQAGCEQIRGGMLSSGLHAAMLEMLKSLERSHFFASNRTLNAYMEAMANEELLVAHYIIPQTMRMASTELTYVVNLLDSTKQMRSYLLGGFVGLSVLCYLFAIQPLLARLDRGIKRSRKLLLLIPYDIVDDVKIRQRILRLPFAQAKQRK